MIKGIQDSVRRDYFPIRLLFYCLFLNPVSLCVCVCDWVLVRMKVRVRIVRRVRMDLYPWMHNRDEMHLINPRIKIDSWWV